MCATSRAQLLIFALCLVLAPAYGRKRRWAVLVSGDAAPASEVALSPPPGSGWTPPAVLFPAADEPDEFDESELPEEAADYFLRPPPAADVVRGFFPLLEAGVEQYNAGLVDEGAVLLRRALAVAPTNGDCVRIYAQSLKDEASWAAMTEHWVKVTARTGARLSQEERIAQIESAQRRMRFWMRRALRLQPHVADLEIGLAELEGRMRLFDRSVARFRRVLRQQPGNAVAWGNLGTAINLRALHNDLDAAADGGGLSDDAFFAFRTSRDLSPTSGTAFANLTPFYNRRNRKEEGTWHARHSLALAPANSDQLVRYGKLLADALQNEEALEWTQKALALRPFDASVVAQEGKQLIVLQRRDEAFATWHHGEKLDPDNSRGLRVMTTRCMPPSAARSCFCVVCGCVGHQRHSPPPHAQSITISLRTPTKTAG